MGNNTLTKVTGGEKVQAADHNSIVTALEGHFLPRSPAGADVGQPVDALYDIGQPTNRWRNGYFDQLEVGGNNIDFGVLQQASHYIAGGSVFTGGLQAAFFDISDTQDSLTIVTTGSPVGITAAPLVFTVNGSSQRLESNLTITTGFQYAPTTNNTCLINNSAYSGQSWTRLEESLTIDAAGSEITALIGQWAAFKYTTGTDDGILLAFIKSATELTEIRQYFFDKDNAGMQARAFSDNQTLTLLRLGWVFLDDDGANTEIVYKTPIYQHGEPDNPDTGDHWFDYETSTWRRYSGSEWQQADRALLGYVVTDDSNVIAHRPFDYQRQFSADNELTEFKKVDDDIMQATGRSLRVSVYGNNLALPTAQPIKWSLADDLEAGVIRTDDTVYYAYLDVFGQRYISDIAPIEFKERLGWYHPFKSGRCVALLYNGTAVIEGVGAATYDKRFQVIDSERNANGTYSRSSYWMRPLNRRKINLYLFGAAPATVPNTSPHHYSNMNFDGLAATSGVAWQEIDFHFWHLLYFVPSETVTGIATNYHQSRVFQTDYYESGFGSWTIGANGNPINPNYAAIILEYESA